MRRKNDQAGEAGRVSPILATRLQPVAIAQAHAHPPWLRFRGLDDGLETDQADLSRPAEGALRPTSG
jgi:hypothetical protein